MRTARPRLRGVRPSGAVVVSIAILAPVLIASSLTARPTSSRRTILAMRPALLSRSLGVATNVQGISPLASQQGVSLDGSGCALPFGGGGGAGGSGGGLGGGSICYYPPSPFMGGGNKGGKGKGGGPSSKVPGAGSEDVDCPPKTGSIFDPRMNTQSCLTPDLGDTTTPSTPGCVYTQGSPGSVVLATGTYTATVYDLALPAPGFSWVVGRNFNGVQELSGSAHESDGPQGKNWFQTSAPEIQFAAGSTADKDLLYFVYAADAYIAFQRTGTSSSTFKAINGAAGIAVRSQASGNDPELYTLTDRNGSTFVFFGFNSVAAPAQGQLWTITDTAGNKAYVGHPTSGSDALTNGFNSGGQLSKAYDSAGRRYTYTCSTIGGALRYTQVKAEVKTGGSWTDSQDPPTGVSEVARVEYSYYQGSESQGNDGCLKTATIIHPLTDSGITTSGSKYYRYYTSAYASDKPGHPNLLKAIVGFEGTRAHASHSSDSDATLQGYCEAFLTYEQASHRLASAALSTACASCSGSAGAGTFTYRYETNGSFSDTSGQYDQEWKTRTVVSEPTGRWSTIYFDEATQPLTWVTTDADPASSNPAKWVLAIERDSNGWISIVHTPANVTSYTHSTGDCSYSTTAGLIYVIDHVASGGAIGHISEIRWKQGTGSSQDLFRDKAFTYSVTSFTPSGADTALAVAFLASITDYTKPITSGPDGAVVSTISTTTYSGSLAVQQITVTHPEVPTSHNGSDASTTSSAYFSLDGTLAFQKDEAGIITYREYSSGAVSKLIEDADTTKTGTGEDFHNVTIPSGFSSTAGAQHLKTTQTFDAQGRLDAVTLPTGRVLKHYYGKVSDGKLVHLEYAHFTSTPNFFGPVRYTIVNHAGLPSAVANVKLATDPATTAMTGHIDESKTHPVEAMTLGTVAQLQTFAYEGDGTRLSEARSYFSIPASGEGTSTSNFDAALLGYDSAGRLWRVKDPTGTIDRSVFDVQSRLTQRWSGTNDSSSSGGEPSGTDDMTKVTELQYDAGSSGGNSHLTQVTQYTDASTTRVTSLAHDARGHALLRTNPLAPHVFRKVDNRGRSIEVGLYSSTSGINLASHTPKTLATNRLSLSEVAFDERGQVYRSVEHKVAYADGSYSESNALTTLQWYDARNSLVKIAGASVVKIAYDRLGDVMNLFTLAKDVDSTYSQSIAIRSGSGGDIVLEEREIAYEAASGNVLMDATLVRNHADFGTNETTGPLDTNADGDRMKYTASDLKGRIQIAAYWFDTTANVGLGRLTHAAAYGTNGGSTFDRSQITSAPSSSASVPVTAYTYASDGSLWKVTDPKGRVRELAYDAAGRATNEVRNSNGGAPSGTDQNQTVAFTYQNGLLQKLTAKMPSGTPDQETVYTHAVVKGTGAGQSKIASNRLVSQVTLPDDASGDRGSVRYAFNAQGEITWFEDQATNVLERVYDAAGRETDLKITTLASGFDGAVRRIGRTFDNLSRTLLVTQYDAASGGSVVDEVKLAYDDFGPISSFQQDPDSAIAGSGGNEFTVGYALAKATAGRQLVRRTSQTYPSGLQVNFVYSSAGGLHDDEVCRVTSLNNNASLTLAAYEYDGAGILVGTSYPEPQISSKLYGSSSGSYPNLDTLNRITTAHWQKDLTTPVRFYNTDLAFDENSNITRLIDHVHASADVGFALDSLNRVTGSTEGTWDPNASPPQIINKAREQLWTLGHTGNWDRAKLDLDGNGSYSGTNEYDDSRTHNKANEILTQDLDSNVSTTNNNATLAHDLLGNLTDDGRRYTFVYDPFGRLRKVYNRVSSNLVAEYRYNGLGHRTAFHQDTDNSGAVDSSDRWYFLVYDPSWRMVAVFRGTSASSHDSDPKEEFVNHAAGLGGFGDSSLLDGVVCRYRDANTPWVNQSDGRLEERTYYCQNARGDVVALVGSDGKLREWARYSTYGIPFGHPAGDADSDGDCDAADAAQILTWINGSVYDVRGDLDLDGDVDATDRGLALGNSGTSLGWGVLSAIGNRKGYAGYERDMNFGDQWHVRNRVLDSDLGRWLQRDPIGYAVGSNLYEYVGSRAPRRTDPLGLFPEEAHKSMTMGALLRSGLSLDCIAKIMNANAAQDTTGTTEGGILGFVSGVWHAITTYVVPTKSHQHFDNSNFIGATKYMKEQVALFMTCDSCDCEKFNANLEALGRALHALQDFYSHSEWIEDHGGTRVEGSGGDVVSGSSIPVFDFGAMDEPRQLPDFTGQVSGGFLPIAAGYGVLWGGHAKIGKDDEVSGRGALRNRAGTTNRDLAYWTAVKATEALWNGLEFKPKCEAALKDCCKWGQK